MNIIHWNQAVFEKEKVVLNVLASNPSAKEIQIIMAKDSVMKEHKAPFAISVQVLSGEIWFEVDSSRVILSALDMVSLEPNIAHSLGGIQDSIIRLSLAQADSIQRVNAVLKQ